MNAKLNEYEQQAWAAYWQNEIGLNDLFMKLANVGWARGAL